MQLPLDIKFHTMDFFGRSVSVLFLSSIWKPKGHFNVYFLDDVKRRCQVGTAIFCLGTFFREKLFTILITHEAGVVSNY